MSFDKPNPSWNVELRGGPRSGVYMELPDTTSRIVQAGPDGVIGEWVRTSEVSEGRTVFQWQASA